MDIKETGVILEAIRFAFPRTFPQENAEKVLTLWATLFEEVPYQQVNTALKTYILTDTSGFPPTIGQINALITEAKMQDLPSAEEAWSLVRKAIGNGIYGAKEEFDALPEMCQRLVGDPSQLYDWAMLDFKGLNVVKSVFVKRYAEVRKNDEFILSLPPKIADNRAMIGASKVKQLAERLVDNGKHNDE